MERGVGLVLKHLAAPDVARIASAAEDCGITHLFLPELGLLGTSPGRDPFITSGAALRVTERMRVGPGIAATPVRIPQLMATQAATLNEESAGRFILGIGVAHRSAFEPAGLEYPASPLGHLRDYLTTIQRVSETVPYGGGFAVMVAALGPKMVALAASMSDGLVLNWMNLDAAAQVVERIRAAASEAGREEPASPLFIRTGPPEALLADSHSYGQSPNYHRHFVAQGMPTAEDVAAGACMPMDPAAIAERVGAYQAAGISVPCIYPTGLDVDESIELLRKVGARLR